MLDLIEDDKMRKLKLGAVSKVQGFFITDMLGQLYIHLGLNQFLKEKMFPFFFF